MGRAPRDRGRPGAAARARDTRGGAAPEVPGQIAGRRASQRALESRIERMGHSARIRRRRRGVRPSRYFLLGFMVVLLAGALVGASAVGWVLKTASSAPPLSSLKQRSPGAISEVLASDGTRLGFIQADDLVQPVDGNAIPEVMKQATVAIEDQ